MICKSPCGKYADGFYGWDSNIHSDEQIFNEEEMPYVLNSAYINVVVGVGDKPSIQSVRNILAKHNLTKA